ncbi:MAG: glycosyltransferase [Planctomycetaceae bacterium]|nr:glycosyltransferase [Planctomycetaceae bacterium]
MQSEALPLQNRKQLSATVVITSKDRKEELRSAVQSALEQSAQPEVLVIDDGSSDGTSEMVRNEFPAARLITHEKPTGLIVGRNEGARLATGDIIFSIDDDAIFTSPTVVAESLELFAAPRIGAVAIPYVDVKQSPELKQLAPDAEQIWITDRYIGTAHALRRDLFLKLGGYRELFFHQGEERDYCVRMLNAGYLVRLGSGTPIHHFESPKRDTTRMDLYGRRNDLLFAWLNDNWSRLPIQLLGTSINGIRFGFRVGRPVRMLQGIGMGLRDIFRFWNERAPLPGRILKTFRSLQAARQTPFKDVLAMMRLDDVDDSHHEL